MGNGFIVCEKAILLAFPPGDRDTMLFEIFSQGIAGPVDPFKIDWMAGSVFRPVVIVVSSLSPPGESIDGSVGESFFETVVVTENLFDSSVNDAVQGVLPVKVELLMVGEHKSLGDHIVESSSAREEVGPVGQLEEYLIGRPGIVQRRYPMAAHHQF